MGCGDRLAGGPRDEPGSGGGGAEPRDAVGRVSCGVSITLL